jgi:hypothetical protein
MAVQPVAVNSAMPKVVKIDHLWNRDSGEDFLQFHACGRFMGFRREERHG